MIYPARRFVVIGTAAAALVLTACGGSSGGSGSTAAGSPASSSTPSSPATSASVAPTSAAASVPEKSDAGVATGSASTKPVAVNKTVTDPVLGEKFTVLAYQLGYQPSPASLNKYSALADEDVVLVEVKVTASKKYYDSFGSDSFYLTDTSDHIDQASTTILDTELADIGYKILKSADTGKTETGWIEFTPPKGLSKLTLRYLRLAATTSGGKTIARKNFDVVLKS